MADRCMFIGWDEPARGREELAVEVFNDFVGYYGRLQQEGKLEGFNAVFLSPTANGLQGYFQLDGTADQLFAIREDAEFNRIMVAATLCVDGMSIRDGYTNEGIAGQMAIYQEAVAKVPQATA